MDTIRARFRYANGGADTRHGQARVPPAADRIEASPAGRSVYDGKVAVFRRAWLPAGETFIRDHVSFLVHWQSVALGVTTVTSPLAAATDVALFSPDQRWRARLFRLTRRSRRMENYLRKGHFGLVHAHFGGDAVLIAPTCRRLDLPLVVTLHGEDVTVAARGRGLSGRLYRRRLRRSLRQADAVLAVSDFIADRAHTLGAPRSSLSTHVLGVRLPVTSPLAASFDYDVLFLGPLVAKKGGQDLIAALAQLKDRGRNVRTAIVGSGPMEHKLKGRARRRRLDVTFMSQRAPGAVDDLMRRSRVVAVPSKTAANGDCEGLPTVVMTAAAHGRPVVAYAHAGIVNAVCHGRTGLLSPEGDVAALSHDLEHFLTHEEARQHTSKAARVHAEKAFNIEKQIAALEDVYSDVVAHHASRPRSWHARRSRAAK